MKKGGGSESTTIVGPSKSDLVYALHSLEYVLGLARFRVFVPNLLLYVYIKIKNFVHFLNNFFMPGSVKLFLGLNCSIVLI